MIRYIYEDKKSKIKLAVCMINYKELNDNYVMEHLGEKEKEYYTNIKYSKVKRQFIWGRIVAKYALNGIENNLVYKNVNILKGGYNEPVIQEIGYKDLKVNISHSNNMVVAVAFKNGYSCGVDIEYISTNSKRISNSILIESERNSFTDIIEDSSLLGLYLWTAKEALSKTIKQGLYLPIEIYDIDELQKHCLGHCGKYKCFREYIFLSKRYSNYIYTLSYPANIKLNYCTEETMCI